MMHGLSWTPGIVEFAATAGFAASQTSSVMRNVPLPAGGDVMDNGAKIETANASRISRALAFICLLFLGMPFYLSTSNYNYKVEMGGQFHVPPSDKGPQPGRLVSGKGLPDFLVAALHQMLGAFCRPHAFWNPLISICGQKKRPPER